MKRFRWKGWSLHVGTVLGFPLEIHASLPIFLGILLIFDDSGYRLLGLLTAVMLFASVAVHELGHSVLARRLGVRIVSIRLYPFGGMARMAGMPRGPKDEMIIAAAGPATSLVIAGISWIPALLLGGTWPGVIFSYLAAINTMLGLFNLLPALPMDGGRILRAYLVKRFGFARATLKAVKVSWVLGFVMVALGIFFSPWLLVIAVFLFLAAQREKMMVMSGMAGYSGVQVRPRQSGPIRRILRWPGGRVFIVESQDRWPPYGWWEK